MVSGGAATQDYMIPFPDRLFPVMRFQLLMSGDAVLLDRYFQIGYIVGWITRIGLFFGLWAYCTSAYGFLFGLGLGWLPAGITAAIVGLVMVPMWGIVAIVILIIAAYLNDEIRSWITSLAVIGAILGAIVYVSKSVPPAKPAGPDIFHKPKVPLSIENHVDLTSGAHLSAKWVSHNKITILGVWVISSYLFLFIQNELGWVAVIFAAIGGTAVIADLAVRRNGVPSDLSLLYRVTPTRGLPLLIAIFGCIVAVVWAGLLLGFAPAVMGLSLAALLILGLVVAVRLGSGPR